jgi:hypothetical protein
MTSPDQALQALGSGENGASTRNLLAGSNAKADAVIKTATASRGFSIITLQTAFLRKPERMQRVQAFTRLTSPDLPSTHRIF